MCDMCDRIREKTGLDLPESVSKAVHHTKDLISWMDKSREIVKGAEGEGLPLAGINILKALEILAHVNFIFVDMIVTDQDVEFAKFLLMMIHSITKNKAQVIEIEKGIMSDPNKVNLVKSLLESLNVKEEKKENPFDNPKEQRRYN